MEDISKENSQIEKQLQKLKEEGNKLLHKHKRKYGYLRRFKKPISALLQNEIDGGDSRELTAFEINEYRMPR